MNHLPCNVSKGRDEVHGNDTCQDKNDIRMMFCTVFILSLIDWIQSAARYTRRLERDHFFTHFCSKQFLGKIPTLAGLSLPEKTPLSQRKVEILCGKVGTAMGHCDLFQRLNEMSATLRVLSFAEGYGALHPRFINQRSDWNMFQTRATCTFGAIDFKM